MILAIIFGIVCIFAVGFIGWTMGGLITGIIFYQEAPINHKFCWTVSGIISILAFAACLLIDAFILLK